MTIGSRENTQTDRTWIEEPPAAIEKQEASLPPSKEVSVVLITPGLFSSLGYQRTYSPKDRTLNVDLGIETTLGFGTGEYDYPFDYKSKYRWIPDLDFMVGLKVAWVILDKVNLAPGPLFCEFVGGALPWPQFPFAIGFGWYGQLDENRHGVVGILYLGPVYVRWQYRFGESLNVKFGFSVLIPLGFVYERSS